MRQSLLLGIGLLLAGLALSFGVGGGFQFDDYPNIVDAENVRAESLSPSELLAAVNSGIAGPTGRPLSVLSFAASHAVHGLDPAAYKATNIALHLLNGLLVYLLSVQLLARTASFDRPFAQHVALVVALAWALHPLQISSVLYIVQRMNELSALFSLVACLFYCIGRQRLIERRPRAWGLIGLSLTLLPIGAALSKENGALTPLYLLLIEACFFRLQCADSVQRRQLLLAIGLLAVTPALLVVLYSAFNPAWFLRGYARRDFTLSERLLTEARVLWTYLDNIVLPSPAQMGLYRDDYPKSASLLSPPRTLAALVGLAILLVVGTFATLRGPRILGFGLLLFLIGHSMESTVIALELVFEHRNYLPSFGLFLAMGGLFGPLLKRSLPRPWPGLAAGLTLAILSVLTGFRAYTWGSPDRWIETEAALHPTSPRAQRDLATHLHRAAAKISDPEARLSMLERASVHAGAAVAFKPLQSENLLTYLLIQRDLGTRPLPSFWDRLTDVAAHGSISASAASQLQALVQCQIEGVCGYDAERVQRLLETAAQNRASGHRTVLLHISGVHAFWTGLDPRRGVDLMEQAIKRNPRQLHLWPSYIRALALSSNVEAAADALQAARQQDLGGAYTEEWMALENEINVARRAMPIPSEQDG